MAESLGCHAAACSQAAILFLLLAVASSSAAAALKGATIITPRRPPELQSLPRRLMQSGNSGDATAYVATEVQLRSALADPAVARIVVTATLALSEDAWPQPPLLVSRNVTVEGDSRLKYYPAINFNSWANRVELAPGVSLVFYHMALQSVRSGIVFTTAPGLALLTGTDPSGPLASLIFQNCIFVLLSTAPAVVVASKNFKSGLDLIRPVNGSTSVALFPASQLPICAMGLNDEPPACWAADSEPVIAVDVVLRGVYSLNAASNSTSLDVSFKDAHYNWYLLNTTTVAEVSFPLSCLAQHNLGEWLANHLTNVPPGGSRGSNGKWFCGQQKYGHTRTTRQSSTGRGHLSSSLLQTAG